MRCQFGTTGRRQQRSHRSCISWPEEHRLLRLAVLLAAAVVQCHAGSCKKHGDCSGRAMCVSGSCVCPVLFSGAACKKPRAPVAKGCVNAFEGWASKGYNPPGIDFSHCAVVGSSSVLKGSKHGKAVDAATAVFRFNEAPTKGSESDVGKWKHATIRLQNKERGGFAERPGERCVIWSTNEYSASRSNKWCKMWKMTPALEAYAASYFKKGSKGKTSGQMAKMSNGFLGVVFALHLCAKVDVYGFDQGQGYYFKKFVGVPKGWGANKSIKPSTRPFKERHSWDRERGCLNALGGRLPGVTVFGKGGAGKRKVKHGPPPAAEQAVTAYNATTALPVPLADEQARPAIDRPAWHVSRWRRSGANITRASLTRTANTTAQAEEERPQVENVGEYLHELVKV